MAQWNQTRGFLGGLNAGHPCHRQHITLGLPTLDDPPQCLRLHPDVTLGNREPVAIRLVSDIDHVGPATGIKMAERLGHTLLLYRDAALYL